MSTDTVENSGFLSPEAMSALELVRNQGKFEEQGKEIMKQAVQLIRDAAVMLGKDVPSVLQEYFEKEVKSIKPKRTVSKKEPLFKDPDDEELTSRHSGGRARTWLKDKIAAGHCLSEFVNPDREDSEAQVKKYKAQTAIANLEADKAPEVVSEATSNEESEIAKAERALEAAKRKEANASSTPLTK